MRKPGDRTGVVHENKGVLSRAKKEHLRIFVLVYSSGLYVSKRSGRPTRHIEKARIYESFSAAAEEFFQPRNKGMTIKEFKL